MTKRKKYLTRKYRRKFRKLLKRLQFTLEVMNRGFEEGYRIEEEKWAQKK